MQPPARRHIGGVRLLGGRKYAEVVGLTIGFDFADPSTGLVVIVEPLQAGRAGGREWSYDAAVLRIRFPVSRS
jgi:hypothetical protein